MSVRWITWAWDQDCANPGEKLTLIALADHAGEDGGCWPSSARLMEKTGLGRSTVFRHLDRLEEAGMLEREQRYREDGSLTSSLIILGRGSPTLGLGGSQSGTEGVPNRDEGSPKSGPLDEPSLEPSLEPSDEPPPLPPKGGEDVEHELFDVFWQSYPHRRRTGKPAAVRAFKAARRKKHAAEDVMRGLRRWTAHWDATETADQFIPHPATWLNQERWNDPCPAIVAPPLSRNEKSRAAIAKLAAQPDCGEASA